MNIMPSISIALVESIFSLSSWKPLSVSRHEKFSNFTLGAIEIVS